MTGTQKHRLQKNLQPLAHIVENLRALGDECDIYEFYSAAVLIQRGVEVLETIKEAQTVEVLHGH